MDYGIIWPTVALVALIYAVWVFMFVKRMHLLRTKPPKPDELATGESALRYFQPVEMPANNLANLFEMPVMFFALVPLLLVTREAGPLQVFLAWLYVLTRIGHSYIHVTRGKVTTRFAVYLASCVVLSAMWIGFAINIAADQAASAAL